MYSTYYFSKYVYTEMIAILICQVENHSKTENSENSQNYKNPILGGEIVKTYDKLSAKQAYYYNEML